MTTSTVWKQFRWTISDLEDFPENGNRYEIIDGELFITRPPHLDHQDSTGALYAALLSWSLTSGMGKPFFTPGVIFSAEAVIPDLIWISHERKSRLMDDAGHLTGVPELVVEVLSKTEKYNRKLYYQTKLKLYSAQGGLEYWIVDYAAQTIAIYRREEGILKQALTLFASDLLTSPLLPGFSCAVVSIF